MDLKISTIRIELIYPIAYIMMAHHHIERTLDKMYGNLSSKQHIKIERHLTLLHGIKGGQILYRDLGRHRLLGSL